MTVSVPVSEQDYLRLALDDPDGHWELHHGQLREKAGMGIEHNALAIELGFALRSQLDRVNYGVRVDAARVRRSTEQYYIPDVVVVPVDMERMLRRNPGSLELYAEPLPLVVEVWSPSTGSGDLRTKVPEYQARGDLEIWRPHPFERTLTAWRRQPDGGYTETVHRSGVLRPASLPAVAIDLDQLFGEDDE